MVGKKAQVFFCCLIIIIVAFYSYWYGRIDLPRVDQVIYMEERGFFLNNWDWFWHSIFFSRTRLTFRGDYYLFRPAHMFFLVIQDIFFRNDLEVTGALSILMFAIVACLLFITLDKMVNRLLAFSVSLVFVSQSVAVEIVLWRHITPYILSFGCLLVAFLFLQILKTKKKYIFFSIFLFLAMGFHEYIVLSTVFILIIIFISWLIGDYFSISKI